MLTRPSFIPVLVSALLVYLLIVLTACGQKTPDPAPVTPTPGVSTGPTTWLTGDAADVTKATTPGMVLMGGSTDVDEAMRWLLRKSGRGDVAGQRVRRV